MKALQEIRALVRNGLYYLTAHADEEAINDGLDIYDIEYCLLNGVLQQSWIDEANTRLSVQLPMGKLSGSFVASRLVGKYVSLPCTQ